MRWKGVSETYPPQEERRETARNRERYGVLNMLPNRWGNPSKPGVAQQRLDGSGWSSPRWNGVDKSYRTRPSARETDHGEARYGKEAVLSEMRRTARKSAMWAMELEFSERADAWDE